MKIAFVGNFRTSASSETHHKKSLEALGHEVIALQESEATTRDILSAALQAEFLVWVHTHGWKTPEVGMNLYGLFARLKANRKQVITYHLDLWFGLKRERDLRADPFYKNLDWFFTVDQKMAEWLNQRTKTTGFYLPAGVFQDEIMFERNSETKYDVVFVGSKGYHKEWPYRPKLINWLQSTYGDRFTLFGRDGVGEIRGQELVDVYNSSKVVIGDSLVKDFSYPYYWSDRLYETLGRGGFMIFPYIKGLEDEFVLGDTGVVPASHDVELVTYRFGDFDQLAKLINYYLVHDEERDSIRRRGFEKVRDNYTYKHRWEIIMKEIGINEPDQKSVV